MKAIGELYDIHRVHIIIKKMYTFLNAFESQKCTIFVLSSFICDGPLLFAFLSLAEWQRFCIRWCKGGSYKEVNKNDVTRLSEHITLVEGKTRKRVQQYEIGILAYLCFKSHLTVPNVTCH